MYNVIFLLVKQRTTYISFTRYSNKLKYLYSNEQVCAMQKSLRKDDTL